MTFIQTVAEVKQNLRTLFPETPLQRNEFLSERYKAEIYLKREDLSPVRSYKIRGAFNLISKILNEPEHKASPDSIKFVCASAGNHAQGFAFACAHFKVHGTVFMPVTTPQQKINKTRVFGGEYITIKLIGDIFDTAYGAAKDFCQLQQGIMVPPFDHPQIVEGQATIGAEILEQIKAPIHTIIMPVGGGGLSAGVSEYFKIKSPHTKLICCEPAGAPSLKDNLENQQHRKIKHVDPFIDGAAVALIGKYNYEKLRQNITEPVELIPENRLCSTLLEFLNHEGLVLEPAGALAIDALKNFDSANLKGKTIVCIVSGGNFDFERLPEVKERSMRFEGLKKYFILRLPQRPGALKEFVELLGPNDDIARFEYLKKSTKSFASILLGIETNHYDNFIHFTEKMVLKGFALKDITNDEILADFII